MYKWVIIIIVISILLVAAGCKEKSNKQPFAGNKLNKSWLQDIISDSDSSYSKRYFRRDFATASYYINKSNSTLTQVMRDSLQQVRQVIMEKKEVRTFYAQFYPNGQVVAIVSLDAQGQYDGEATVFYPDGQVKSKGRYLHGLYNGVWETYNEQGRLILKEEFGNNGQLLKTSQ